MEKVMIEMVTGTKMLFPAQYAKKVIKKNELVRKAYELDQLRKQAPGVEPEVIAELKKIMGQIIRLNRQIPPCGEVVR